MLRPRMKAAVPQLTSVNTAVEVTEYSNSSIVPVEFRDICPAAVKLINLL